MDTKYSDFSYFGILHFFTTAEIAARALYVDDISIDAIDRTIPTASDTKIVSPEEQVAGGNISSLDRDTIEVIRFEIQDVADSDTLPTYLRQVTVKNAKPSSSANWKTAIKNAYLYAENIGNLQITNTAISEDSIVFRFGNNLRIPPGDAVDLSMKIVLGDSLTDNSSLQFKIDRTNHGFLSSINGSGMIAELTGDILSGVFTVDVEADTILWISVPDIVSINADFSGTAIAADNKGNVDKDFSSPADLVLNTGSGNLTFSSLAFVNGELVAGDVSYDKAENISLQLSSESVSSANSYVTVILNKNSSIENPLYRIAGTAIMSDAVNIENEIPVFRFVIKDLLGDNAATFVSELKISNPFNETNWLNVIGGISLYDGEQRLISNIIDQKRDYIHISLFAGSLTVDDGAEKEITLKIWLKTKVPDKTRLGFMIPATNHGSLAAQNGSLFANDFIQNIVSDTFSVEVQATKIIFKTSPTTVAPDSPFSLEINAVNGDGMIDIDETGEITLELEADNGNLSNVSGMEKQFVEGKVVWTDLIIDTPTIFRIKARHPYFGEIRSDEIASMNMDSELLPVLTSQKSVFKSVDTLISTAKEVIRFKISDKGTGDGLATVINKMVFSTISDMSIPDLIGGAELLSDGQNISVSFTSTSSQITVMPENLIIPDGESREIILKIFLKRAKYVDGSKLQLYIPATAHGWTVNQNSSQLLKTFEYPVYSNVHSIDIEASQLTVISQPMIALKNTPFSFSIGATDYTGNVDTSYNNSISILKSDGAGNLHNLSTKHFAGISTFSVVYDSLSDFSVRASSAGMADIVSMPIYSVNAIDTTVKSGISAWNDVDDWVWDGNRLKHNSGNGFSYVSAPANIDLAKKIVQWDFIVENGNFDPSSENAFWCVLSSDTDDLDDSNLSGYIAGVNYTGSSDLLSFWKVKSGNKQLLWSSDYNWDENARLRIIVQKSENEWRVFIKEEEQPILLAGKFMDNEVLESKFTGFVFKYTSTRNGMFSIDNYEIIETIPPLKVREVEILDKNNIKVSFNTNIAFPEALDIDNYLLKSVSNVFDIFDVAKINDNEVNLNTKSLGDTLFLLSISGITDVSGSIIKDTIVELRRNASEVKCSIEVLSRISLVLEFGSNMIDSIATDTDNYTLINVLGDTFLIAGITENSGKYYLDCDSLQGNSFILYYNNLETEDGFILNDSLIFNKSYLPAKINSAEALSNSTVTVEFSKNIQEVGNYTIKNSRGTVFDIVSKTVNGKHVTLTLSGTLSGNNFVLYVSGA
ncbi:MAG: hypothetical protein LBK96_03195, partial [Prevotellaceae bacterium]|nr:hypothetical protein [Prevotellaceae bacterium]